MTPEVEALLRTLPRKIKVGAYDWRIVIEDGENDTLGMTVFDNSRIHLWPDMFPDPVVAMGTVLHELLHVIYDNHELDGVVGDREESIVKGYENGLVSLFRDNPKLLTWIKRCLR